jgi:hypothetical protein
MDDDIGKAARELVVALLKGLEPLAGLIGLLVAYKLTMWACDMPSHECRSAEERAALVAAKAAAQPSARPVHGSAIELRAIDALEHSQGSDLELEDKRVVFPEVHQGAAAVDAKDLAERPYVPAFFYEPTGQGASETLLSDSEPNISIGRAPRQPT